MNNSLIWLVWFFLFAIVAVLVIPRKNIMQLLPFGITAGFVLSLAILLLNVPLLKLWVFDTIPANSILGVPLTLPLVFIPVIMLFVYYIPHMKSGNLLIPWITAFAAFTTLVQGLSVSAGIMHFLQWDLLATLLLTFSIYFFLAFFILKYGNISQKQDPS